MSVRWISVVWSSSPYRGERLLIHLALADFANDEGRCFPSQTTLARKARCSDNYVRLTIKQMVSDGALVVERDGGGRGVTTIYQLKPPTANGDSRSAETPNSKRPALLMNRNEPSIVDREFDEWWNSYPRKVGKGGARREWQRLKKQRALPAVEVLIQATRRYAQTISDLKYCAHPTTWLKQERWADEEQATTQTAIVELSGDERTAVNLAAAFLVTNRTESELIEALNYLPQHAIEAGISHYRKVKR
jgi:hypothetical protein